MGSRSTLLSAGAAGGLFVLACCDSILLASLLGLILGWSWLMIWIKGTYCTSNERLDGKIAVVTGSNTGIGKETARALSSRGARVVMACRDIEKANNARQEIQAETGVQVDVMKLDLASFASVRQFAKELTTKFAKLDILVNNAGIAFHPRQLTEDGQEQVFQVNHLSHFLLTNLLLDLLKAADNARVINLSSMAYSWAKKGIQWKDLKWEETPFDSWAAYAQSKLANIYFTRELARKQSQAGINVYAVHPGAVKSELGRAYMAKVPSFLSGPLMCGVNKFLKDEEGGSQTSVNCAVEASLQAETGKYYSDCSRGGITSLAMDDKEARKLWQVSKDIVGDITPLKPKGKPIVETIGEISTKDHSLLSDIKSGTILTPVKSSEPLSGADLMMQEMIVKDVEKFDKTDLKKADTQEPMSGIDLLKKELETKSLNEELSNFNKSGLKETEIAEKNILPGEREIRLEREKIELIGGIENFDVDNLSRVTMKEPLSGAELLRQELSHKAMQEEIGSFDQQGLRSTEVKEENWLPGSNDIQEEKDKVQHLSGIELFNTESMNKVKTPEPLSGAELLQRELVKEELESFDTSNMNPITVDERNIVPDPVTMAEEKARENLLKGIETFSQEEMAHVVVPTPLSGADLVKQELGIKSIVESVSTFDSSSLRPTTTTEKVLLPDMETIHTERDRVNLLRDLESEHTLSPVIPKEPLGGAALLKQELTRQHVLEGVEAFNIEGLKRSEVQEKSILPDKETIEQEKSEVEHLAGIGSFDRSSLAPVKVSEPLTGPEVSKQENQRSEIASALATFDMAGLKETEVAEKAVLPGVEDIQAERQHHDHIQGLQQGMELRKTETREPANPLDLAKLELNKDRIEEELQEFDRARLTPVVTEEKLFLPSAEDLRAEVVEDEMDRALDGGQPEPRGAQGLRGLLDDDGREQRSSSEEWEKVDSEC